MKTAEDFADVFGWGDGITKMSIAALIEARDAEHRAELDAAQATIEQLGKDAAALATENERLKGELAEAKRLIESCPFTTMRLCDESIQWTMATTHFLAAPPPAESTPVQPAKAHETNYGREAQLPSPNTDGRIGTKARDTSDAEGKAKVAGESPAAPSIHVHGTDAQPAPPDDIRERLADHDRRLAALEAKGEPGSNAGDRCALEGCRGLRVFHGPPSDHAFVEPKGAKP